MTRIDQPARVGARWSRIGLVLSVFVVAVALVVLYRILQGIDLSKVVGAIRATELWRVAVAACAVAASYFTLTFYDVFALRMLGHRTIPYRVVWRAAFASFSIGHNAGVATLIGAAVRYRFYSPYGIDASDVARMCFLVALTFWLGNLATLGVGVALEPRAAAAIDQLSPFANTTLAVAVLVVLGAYVLWVWSTPRAIGHRDWNVRLPNGPSTLLQIVIGIADLLASSLAMYVLLPAEPSIGFGALAVVFVCAMMLGFASHAPSGLGVFDATMLIALAQFDPEPLLASLLLFRLLYYFAPLVIGLAMLGTRELVAAMKQIGCSSRRSGVRNTARRRASAN